VAKTVTVRLDDEAYELIKTAAQGDRRSMANFIEYAALSFISQQGFVPEEEMEDILADSELLKALDQGRKDYGSGRYKVVE
jgi:uncharacterized protein (DUF1778 family)